MRAARCPSHLLTLDHTLAHDLMDRRFDKAGRDPFAVAVTLAIIGDELLIALDLRVQLLHTFQ